MISNKLKDRLESAFTPPQIEALTDLLEAHMRSVVKASDFNELKEIVRDLGEAQKRTEVKVETLAETMREMAKTQTEMQLSMAGMQHSMAEMLRSQTGMQHSMAEMLRSQTGMQHSIAELSRGLDDVRSIAGSNSQTLGYMLENEAYRNIPAWLKDRHGIEVTGRMIRQQIGDEEINLLVEARQGAEDILIVGEAKSRLHLSDLGL
ncbi:MAG: hypothetical protein ACREDU_08840, partial [Methylocella sp.]